MNVSENLTPLKCVSKEEDFLQVGLERAGHREGRIEVLEGRRGAGTPGGGRGRTGGPVHAVPLPVMGCSGSTLSSHLGSISLGLQYYRHIKEA